MAIAEQGKKIKSGIMYLGGSSLDSHDTKTFNMVAWLDSMVINHDLDDRLVVIKELVYSNPKKPSAAQPLYHYEAGIAYFIGSYLYSPDVLYHEGIITDRGKIQLEVSLDNETSLLTFNSIPRANT